MTGVQTCALPIYHDIDDAIRGNILSEEGIPSEYRRVLGPSTRIRLDTMIHDVIIHSMDQPQIRMSKEVMEAMLGLRRFMYENVYRNPAAKGEEEKAAKMIENLYEYYMKHLEAIPRQFLIKMENGESVKEQTVCDYIAGMTDTYAIKKFEEYFVPESWKI